MNWHLAWRVTLLLSLSLLLTNTVNGANPAWPPIRSTVTDTVVLDQLAMQERVNVFVNLTASANLTEAEMLSDKAARRQFVYETLTAYATQAQANLKRWLDQQGIRYESFWIDNSLYLYDVNRNQVLTLATHPDVARIRADIPMDLVWPTASPSDQEQILTVEWGVTRINADEVWATGNTGGGAVVGIIDTGVRYTHEALINHYRGNNGDGTFTHDYNWWHPQHTLLEPTDNVGHGTHLMGTAVGGDGPGPLVNDIGVAPGANWIAAKGCEGVSCSQSSLLSSAQWMLCPTKRDGTAPDCSKAPDVVNNSWGGSGGDDWFQAAVNAWVAADIIPVFPVGSSGPGCGTVGSLADYANVIGVGATTQSDVLASFSSKGPGMFRRLKPDFVAPGENIRSAYNNSDTAYAILSGTSMAVPHTVGTLALMLSANPGATLPQLYQALRASAEQALGAPSAPTTCLGRPYTVYPNLIYGWGRLDAAGAVAAITP